MQWDSLARCIYVHWAVCLDYVGTSTHFFHVRRYCSGWDWGVEIWTCRHRSWSHSTVSNWSRYLFWHIVFCWLIDKNKKLYERNEVENSVDQKSFGNNAVCELQANWVFIISNLLRSSDTCANQQMTSFDSHQNDLYFVFQTSTAITHSPSGCTHYSSCYWINWTNVWMIR